ncbi:MAG: UbiA family prenyltransferase [Candidatus Aenigmatarchaeota archaeon]
MRIRAYVDILRPMNGVMASLGVMIGAILAGVGTPLPLEFFTAVAIAFMISGAGMIVNDYFDYYIDRVNRPNRVLPSGKISRGAARLYAASLYIVSNLLAISLLNTYLVTLTFFNSLVTYFYAEKLKKRPVGHVAIGWLTASAFLYGGLIFGSVRPLVLLLAAMAFFTNISREIVKAVEDMRGDKMYSVRSLPLTIGVAGSRQIAAILAVIAIIFSFIPVILHKLSAYYFPIMVVADAMFAYAIIIMGSPSRSQRMMKLAMLVAIFAFLAGLA